MVLTILPRRRGKFALIIGTVNCKLVNVYSNGHLNRYYLFVFVIHGLEINLSCFSKGWWSRALMKTIMGNVAEVILTTKCKYVSHLASPS